MKHFALSLAESEFVLGLESECAALLAALYPTARPIDAARVGVEDLRITIRRAGTVFEVESRESGATPPPRRFPDPASAMLALGEEIERRVLREVTGLLALHGSAVSTRAGACLVLGNSGSGKSSTAFQLAELGHPCLCEEIALCEPASRRIRPYPRTLSLSERLIEEFSADFSIRGRLHRIGEFAVRYEPAVPNPVERRDEPVTRILLPRFLPGAETGISTVAAEDALLEVLGYCFAPNVDTELQFDRAIDLIQNTETTRLIYSGAASARAALGDLFPG